MSSWLQTTCQATLQADQRSKLLHIVPIPPTNAKPSTVTCIACWCSVVDRGHHWLMPWWWTNTIVSWSCWSTLVIFTVHWWEVLLCTGTQPRHSLTARAWTIVILRLSNKCLAVQRLKAVSVMMWTQWRMLITLLKLLTWLDIIYNKSHKCYNTSTQWQQTVVHKCKLL